MQDTSLEKYLLAGVYTINPLQDAKMDSLKLIDKRTGKTFQVIDLSLLDFPAGNLITNIFRMLKYKMSKCSCSCNLEPCW